MGRFHLPSLASKYTVKPNIIIEPVRGCKFQCRQCAMGDLPVERKFMGPKKLDRRLAELKQAGLGKWADGTPGWRKQYSVSYTCRGNPLDHENLDEITRVVQNRLPGAKINSFWNLGGVPSKAELVRRTKGLHQLILSLDSHHFAGLYREFKNAPRARGLSAAEMREKTFGIIRPRVGWAIDAAKQNGFSVKVQITHKGERFMPPTGSEKDLFEKLVPPKGSKALAGVEWTVDSSRRVARGSSVHNNPQSLVILHDGKFSEVMPAPDE